MEGGVWVKLLTCNSNPAFGEVICLKQKALKGKLHFFPHKF